MTKTSPGSNHQGFSLLELIVGLMLSAMLGTVLFNVFFQSNRTLRFVEEYAELDTNTSVIIKHMERDLAGALEPAYSKEQVEAEKKEEAPTKGDKGQKKEKKEKKSSFVAKTKNNQLDFLTFITTNPRSRYGAPLPTITPQPSLVRVMYTLREHKEKKGVFTLLRQESTNLDRASFSKKNEKRPRELVVSDTVHQCLLEYLYRDVSDDDEKKDTQKDRLAPEVKGEQKKADMKTVQNWGDREDEKRPLLPLMVKLTLTVGDARLQVQRSITYFMPVYSTYREPKQTQEPPQKQEQPKQSGGAQPQANVMPPSMPVPVMQPVPVVRPMPFAKPKRRTLAELMGRG